MITSEEKTILKIAIINDLMGIQLKDIEMDEILEPETKSKLRNAKKTTEILTKHFDEMIPDVIDSTLFGDLCDSINEFINESMKGQ